MSIGNQHQDWEERILKKKIVKKQTNNHRKVNRGANDFDPENVKKPIMSNKELGSAIQKARTAKNFTQSQLDQMCNFPKNTIKNYEQGKAIVKPNELNKLNRILGVKLPRPKKN
jgi:ribosome-binding protein aMBF1 (putative translation factor)